MKILIVGGGIGGVAAANFLERKGFQVTLVERAPEFKNIGFSITLFPNGRRLLRELGLDDEVAKHGYKLPSLEFADSKGHLLGVKIHFDKFLNFGEPIVSIERAYIHGLLVENLERTKVKLGTTVRSFSNRKNGVNVILSDGTHEIFDLMIAADGINSHIRDQVFGKNKYKYYGWSLRFFWVPKHIPPPKGVLCLSQEKTTFAVYPLRKKCCVGIYEYNPKRINHPPLPIEKFLPYLKKHGWTQEHINDLAEEAKEGHQYYDHLKHVVVDGWYKKRVALLGDSKHGLSPIIGMGASLALEDSYVLADELSKVDKENIPVALKKYAARRNKRVKGVIGLSGFTEKFYFIKSSSGRMVRNFAARLLPERFFVNRLEEILNTPV